jgi:hypothetical protein
MTIFREIFYGVPNKASPSALRAPAPAGGAMHERRSALMKKTGTVIFLVVAAVSLDSLFTYLTPASDKKK